MSTQAPTARAAQKVFVCYRREETAAHAGRVYDAMVARFGERNVFMDVDMEPGVDFIEQITEVVSSCVALIVVMGPSWGTVAGEDGVRRIDDPDDFVRLEVETALQNKVHVIPVLVHGARMPKRENLPPELQPLARRNALEMSEGRWAYDVGRLLEALDERVTDENELPAVAAAPGGAVELNPQPPSPLSWRLLGEGTLVAATTAAAAYLLSSLIPAPAERKWAPTGTETAEHIVGWTLRNTVTAALTGLALALWLTYRRTGPGRFVPWVRGLVLGAIGGAIGGLIFTLPVFLPDVNLPSDQRRRIELGAIAVTGGFLGGLIGSLWRPPRIGAALLGGAAGGFLFQLVVVATEWEHRGTGWAALSYGLGAAAIVAMALVVLLVLDRRTAAAADG